MISKIQAKKEREQIKEMGEKYKELTDAGKAEFIKLKCRNELITFCVIMSMKIRGEKFKPHKVHRVITDFVQRSLDGEEGMEYTTISLPPRAGKSTIISQYAIAWQLGRNPRANIIAGSHTLSLVGKNLSRVIQIMSSPEYLKMFPKSKLVTKGLDPLDFKLLEGGAVLGGTPKTKVSGFSAGTISFEEFPGLTILDDLLASGNSAAELNTAWNWAADQLLARSLPNLAIISMGTRFSVSDVTGRLIEADPDRWKSLNVPALCIDPNTDLLEREKGESFWEELYPTHKLEMMKKIQGENFQIIYQGVTPGSKGNILTEDDIIRVPEHLNGNLVFFSIDTNFKKSENGDYNAVCVWKKVHGVKDSIQLIDVLHDKADFSNFLILLDKLVKFYNPLNIVVEGKANGNSLISLLERDYEGITIHGFDPTRDKNARFNFAAPDVKRGKVSFYSGINHLEDTYIKQLLQFPYSENDDFADAFSLGILFHREVICSGNFSQSDGGGLLGYGLMVEQYGTGIDTSVLKIGTELMRGSGKSASSFL